MTNPPLPPARPPRSVQARPARRAFRIVACIVVLALAAVVIFAQDHGPTQVTGTVACSAPNAPSDSRVADVSGPHGIFAFGGWSGTHGRRAGEVNRYLLQNPDICGASMGFQWNEIDNGPGARTRYNWSVVDNRIAPWARAGKIVNLLFSGTGEGVSSTPDDTPQYVRDQVKMITCPRTRPTPVLWQPGYEDNWKAFIAAAVKHFGDDPNVGYMRFGLGTDAEGVLWPEQIVKPACGSAWDAAGYRTACPVYIQQMIAFLGSLHSRRPLVIGLSDASNFPPIAEEARQAAALGIGFGVESLTGVEATDILSKVPCDEFNWCQLYDQYAGKVPLYVQDLNATTPISGAENEGLLPPLLEASVKVHVQIFEVNVADLLLTFDPNFPHYGQYHESYAAAIAATARIMGTYRAVAPVT